MRLSQVNTALKKAGVYPDSFSHEVTEGWHINGKFGPWTMTRGGPGFTSDVIASVIYKQYQAGFYGLSTAGNVVLFVLVAAIIVPLSAFLNRGEDER